jgi:hypothetical protein
MNAFQLDECLNDKRLADLCNAEGHCVVRRFPRRLREQKDFVVLPDLLAKDAPLVTIDFPIVDENKRHIPEVNAGLIIVRTRNVQRPFTAKSATQNMQRFKQKFPDWAEADWSGIHLEIDEYEIYIGQLGALQANHGHVIRLDRENFAEELRSKLQLLRPRKLSQK